MGWIIVEGDELSFLWMFLLSLIFISVLLLCLWWMLVMMFIEMKVIFVFDRYGMSIGLLVNCMLIVLLGCMFVMMWFLLNSVVLLMSMSMINVMLMLIGVCGKMCLRMFLIGFVDIMIIFGI